MSIQYLNNKQIMHVHVIRRDNCLLMFKILGLASTNLISMQISTLQNCAYWKASLGKSGVTMLLCGHNTLGATLQNLLPVLVSLDLRDSIPKQELKVLAFHPKETCSNSHLACCFKYSHALTCTACACMVCGRVCTSKIGLASHMRCHRPSNTTTIWPLNTHLSKPKKGPFIGQIYRLPKLFLCLNNHSLLDSEFVLICLFDQLLYPSA